MRNVPCRLGSAAALALLLGCVAAAQQRDVELEFESVGVYFTLPPGFSALSAEEVASVYGDVARSLKHVYGDRRRDVTLAVIATDYNPSAEYLPVLRKQLEEDAEKHFPGLVWMTRGYVTINGRKWLRLSFKFTDTDGAEAVNDYYHTAWGDKLVTLNFHVTPALYRRHRAALERSARTLGLTLSVIAPAPGGRPHEE